MSQENVETAWAVQTSITVSTKADHRSLEERIMVRFPALFRLLALAWSRLSPDSWLRQRLNPYLLGRGYGAANRRDFEVLLLRLDPEIETQFDGSAATGLIAPDLLGVHRGHEGYVRVWQAVMEALEDARLVPEQVIDFGERLLVTGRTTEHGTSSGLAIDEPLFQLFTFRRGLVIQQTDFTDRDRALKASELRE
jgi:ketosteroid isomerase-like protein